MSKFKYIIPTSLISGGMVLGAIFSPISLSSAQSDGSADDGGDPTTVPAPESNRNADGGDSSEGGRDGQPGQHRRGGFGKEALEELGLTVDDLKAGHEAGQTLVETAAAAGISEADLQAALEQSASDRLAQAVADGKIDEAKAAEIQSEMSAKISERINTVHEGRPGGGGPGQGRQGPNREALIETLTELGLDQEELQAGREAGQTLAETAAAAGISEDALVDALIADAQEHLATAAEDGRIDDERLAQIEDNIEERISNMVNRTPGERGERGQRPGSEGPADDGSDV